MSELLPPPKQVEKFFTAKFLNLKPPATVYGVRILGNVRTQKGFPKKDKISGQDATKDVMAFDVEYQGTTYTYKGDEVYKLFYEILGPNLKAWKDTTFNAQAIDYPNLQTVGLVPIKDSIKSPNKPK